MHNPYREALQVLGITSTNPSKKEVTKAYRKKAMTTHPDKGGKNEDFQKISAAYELLNGALERGELSAYNSVIPKSLARVVLELDNEVEYFIFEVQNTAYFTDDQASPYYLEQRENIFEITEPLFHHAHSNSFVALRNHSNYTLDFFFHNKKKSIVKFLILALGINIVDPNLYYDRVKGLIITDNLTSNLNAAFNSKGFDNSSRKSWVNQFAHLETEAHQRAILELMSINGFDPWKALKGVQCMPDETLSVLLEKNIRPLALRNLLSLTIEQLRVFREGFNGLLEARKKIFVDWLNRFPEGDVVEKLELVKGLPSWYVDRVKGLRITDNLDSNLNTAFNSKGFDISSRKSWVNQFAHLETEAQQRAILELMSINGFDPWKALKGVQCMPDETLSVLLEKNIRPLALRNLLSLTIEQLRVFREGFNGLLEARKKIFVDWLNRFPEGDVVEKLELVKGLPSWYVDRFQEGGCRLGDRRYEMLKYAALLPEGACDYATMSLNSIDNVYFAEQKKVSGVQLKERLYRKLLKQQALDRFCNATYDVFWTLPMYVALLCLERISYNIATYSLGYFVGLKLLLWELPVYCTTKDGELDWFTYRFYRFRASLHNKQNHLRLKSVLDYIGSTLLGPYRNIYIEEMEKDLPMHFIWLGMLAFGAIKGLLYSSALGLSVAMLLFIAAAYLVYTERGQSYSAMDIAACGVETQKAHKILDVVAFVCLAALVITSIAAPYLNKVLIDQFILSQMLIVGPWITPVAGAITSLVSFLVLLGPTVPGQYDLIVKQMKKTVVRSCDLASAGMEYVSISVFGCQQELAAKPGFNEATVISSKIR